MKKFTVTDNNEPNAAPETVTIYSAFGEMTQTHARDAALMTIGKLSSATVTDGIDTYIINDGSTEWMKLS